MRTFDIVAAADDAGGIGVGGKLPWNLPGDFKHFKDTTCRLEDPSKQNAVIMGRKTWESLPEKFRPLPKRINIVLTHQKNYVLPSGVIKFENLTQSMEDLEKTPWANTIENIFVIGGGEVFKEAIPHPACRKIYLTKIHGVFDCDVFLPPFFEQFKETFRSGPFKEHSTEYFFVEYTRQQI